MVKLEFVGIVLSLPNALLIGLLFFGGSDWGITIGIFYEFTVGSEFNLADLFATSIISGRIKLILLSL